MALPKRKISKRRKGKRRADATRTPKIPNLGKCSHCSQPKESHMLCPNCKKY